MGALLGKLKPSDPTVMIQSQVEISGELKDRIPYILWQAAEIFLPLCIFAVD